MTDREDGAPVLILQIGALLRWVEGTKNHTANMKGKGIHQPGYSLLLMVSKLVFAVLTTISWFLPHTPLQIWKQFKLSSAAELCPCSGLSEGFASDFVWD